MIFLVAVLVARRRWLDGSADKRGASMMFVFISSHVVLVLVPAGPSRCWRRRIRHDPEGR